FVSLLVGCMLFFAVIVAVNFKRAAQGDTSTPLPNNRLISFTIVYSLPTLALILGAMGKLPGTRSEKSAPPVTGAPTAPPVLPPAIPGTGASYLSRDQVAAVFEKVIEQKFAQDRPLLSPELFDALLRCIYDKKTFNFTAAKSGRPSEQIIAAFEQA